MPIKYDSFSSLFLPQKGIKNYCKKVATFNIYFVIGIIAIVKLDVPMKFKKWDHNWGQFFMLKVTKPQRGQRHWPQWLFKQTGVGTMLSAFIVTQHSHILRYWGLGFNIWNLGVGMMKPILIMTRMMIKVSQWLKLYLYIMSLTNTYKNSECLFQVPLRLYGHKVTASQGRE